MEIRVIGRKEECETAKQYYDSLRSHPQTRSVSISTFYPCRGSAELFRVYIKIEYYDEPGAGGEVKRTDATALDKRTINNAHVSVIRKRSSQT